jgi:hypothetical protein
LTDSEVLTLAIVGQWRVGVPWQSERGLVRWANSPEGKKMFPGMLQRSQFNERVRDLYGVLVQLQQDLAAWLTGPDAIYECVDCAPLPAFSNSQALRDRAIGCLKAAKAGAAHRAGTSMATIFSSRPCLVGPSPGGCWGLPTSRTAGCWKPLSAQELDILNWWGHPTAPMSLRPNAPLRRWGSSGPPRPPAAATRAPIWPTKGSMVTVGKRTGSAAMMLPSSQPHLTTRPKPGPLPFDVGWLLTARSLIRSLPGSIRPLG